jgi:hypothetical protein
VRRPGRWALALLLAAPGALRAQPVAGTVAAAESQEPLPAANVYWLGTAIGTAADIDGRFAVPPPPQWPARLVASFVGFKPDTLLLSLPPTQPIAFRLRWAAAMGPVEVVERAQGVQLSTRTIGATETIGAKELKRAACCDLSESFETNATVDVSYSDAVSGAKTIRMLGLDGRYAQLSLENIPFVRGLSAASGLTLLPGTWIKDINLSKGVGTAVNGPNAITGQIDLCLVDPLDHPPLLVNLYGNTQGRTEANVHLAQRTGAHSANLLLLHGNRFQRAMDQNGDGLLDMPRTGRINIMDRWRYQSERRNAQASLRVVDDLREGGQADMGGADPAMSHPHGHNGPYTIEARNRMVDGFGKYGWVFAGHPTASIGLLFAVRRHESTMRYGLRRYDGLQQSAYANAVFQQLLRDGNDQLKAGLSFQYDDYDEVFLNDTVQRIDAGRTERMPGLFAEHTLKRGALTVVSGLRADWNTRFGGALSPRLHAKYDLGPLTVVRASVGRGFRAANPLAEQPAVMASSRRVLLSDSLRFERAWNLGASVLHKFKWLQRKWAVGIDLYRTAFTAQLVADLDRSPQQLALYMSRGPAYANSVLVDAQVELLRGLLFKGSYRYYDVRTTYDGRLLERPFTPAHRGLLDLSYATPNDRWRFDAALNLFGPSRIPSTAANPAWYRLMERAPAYETLHLQATVALGDWELYAGGENLTSSLQRYQAIAPNDPFGPYFDASLIWGPTNKAMGYAGLRWTPKPRNHKP